jgi:hypothetical protein
MDILINPAQYDADELEDIVAVFYEVAIDGIDEGYDANEIMTGMAIALRMLAEEHGEKQRLN